MCSKPFQMYNVTYELRILRTGHSDNDVTMATAYVIIVCKNHKDKFLVHLNVLGK